MAATFDWDDDKAANNLRKHSVSFMEAVGVFFDRQSRTIIDVAHSRPDEVRFIIVGRPGANKVLVVVYCYRGRLVRLISARKATRRERREYEKSIQSRS